MSGAGVGRDGELRAAASAPEPDAERPASVAAVGRPSVGAAGRPVLVPAGDPQTWGLFMLLSLIWGSSYLFIKVALDEGMSPLTIVSLRTLLGGAFLALVMVVAKGRLPRSGRAWFDLGVVGMANVALPYTLITWGELSISSSMAGILTALVPLFTVVLASFVLRDEPMSMLGIGGLVVGFAGVVLLAIPSLSVARDGDDSLLPLAGMLAVAMAAVLYAIAVVYTRRRLSGRALVGTHDGGSRPMTALEISFGQLFVAMIVITLAAVIFERPEGGLYALPDGTTAIFAIIWLGVLGTGVAYLLYFGLIGRWGATRASLIAYVMPVVAVILGFLILDERLQPLELLGTVLVIGGIVLVNARPKPPSMPVRVEARS